jgi:hypothetical protein
LKAQSFKCLRGSVICHIPFQHFPRSTTNSMECFTTYKIFPILYLIFPQKVQIRNSLGYRDDSVYESGSAGRGAQSHLKRKG